MRTFIQLRDGIGYALIHSEGELDHSVTPDHTTAIEVTGADNPDQFLKKKYDEETKSWIDAPIIRWAEVNGQGVPIEVHATVFLHEIRDASLIMPDEADGSWKFIDGEWLAPVIFVPSEPVAEQSQTMIESSHVEGEQN